MLRLCYSLLAVMATQSVTSQCCWCASSLGCKVPGGRWSYCSKRKHGIFVMSFSKYFFSGLLEFYALSLGHSHPLSQLLPDLLLSLFCVPFSSSTHQMPLYGAWSHGCYLTLEHGWPIIGSSVKENGFLSASSQQLPSSCSAGEVLPGHLLSPCWLCSGLRIYGAFACCHHHCELICAATMSFHLGSISREILIQSFSLM